MSISLMAVYVDDAVCDITEYTRDSFKSLNIIHKIRHTLYGRSLSHIVVRDLSAFFHARNWQKLLRIRNSKYSFARTMRNTLK